jgi:hypothetical protein
MMNATESRDFSSPHMSLEESHLAPNELKPTTLLSQTSAAMINATESRDFSSPHMSLEETHSPPPALISKKRRLSYGVTESVMSLPRALPVDMPSSLFLPDLDETDQNSEASFLLRPRLDDYSPSDHQFHRILRRPSRRDACTASNLFLPPCPVPTLEDTDEVITNSEDTDEVITNSDRPSPILTSTIRRKINFLYACCA